MTFRLTLRLRALVACLCACAAPLSQASCGAATCSLMTDRFAQGSGEPHPGWSTDLRLEHVTQRRLRSGTRSLDASEVTGEEAIERRTSNLNLVSTLVYGIDRDWSLAASLPLVRRDHEHDLVDDQTGLPTTPERWRFTRLGDLQLTARRHWQFAGGDGAVAAFGGFKLPTGPFRVANSEGVRAERTLQPGTGTTDGMIGAALRRAVGPGDALFGQASLTQALNMREGFKPGMRVEVSAGWSHAYTRGLGAVLQLNLRHRAHDSGSQAEPDNSGSTTLDLSPGATIATGPASTLYAYVQLPAYQKVRGIQLVPRSALVIGWTGDY